MPVSSRPPTTGYERLAQADRFSDADDDGSDHDPLAASYASLQPASIPRYAPITSGPRQRSGMSSPRPVRPKFRRRGGSSGTVVDLKAINARLERWADEIASRFKRGRDKSSGLDDESLEIHYSVFQPPDGVQPVTAEDLAEQQKGIMARREFDAVVESVRSAIRQEVHPSMISQGSSGSYFARSPDGKIVGVFKPKDEEPYAAGNPKWNKWIHRNLFPCFFGRACLIPNLSYVSEAAAYVLDCQLRTHLVPHTDVVWLSSKSFHYPFWDRRKFSRGKRSLPEKPGSFQVFLKGFKDANVFLREHPWPDQYWSGFRANGSHKRRRKRWTDNCRPSSAVSADDADSVDDDDDARDENTLSPDHFVWTENLKQSFREELEKLVILDYIMRNTDRGLDNWMIKVDWETGQVRIASDAMHVNMEPGETEDGPRPVDASRMPLPASRASHPYRSQKPMAASNNRTPAREPVMSVGAIDNSLSWPWKHPDGWRSFPFGWLFLPVDLIGRPFSQSTRDHFLPLLTSKAWWSQTQVALKRAFQMDVDFQERMFAKQLAVMKGQAWNVVEALKTADHGPLELTRRTKVCVWDDLVDVPVAVPMRTTSAELRRDHGEAQQSMDEQDIAGSAAANPGPADDLLGFASPPAEMPHPGRFELSASPGEEESEQAARTGAREDGEAGTSRERRHAMLGRYHASYHGNSLDVYDVGRPQRPAQQLLPRQQRRFSLGTGGMGRRSISSSIAQQLYGEAGDEEEDDVGGDLGYAAAEGQMGNQRKVIVERLEPVKSKNPVFTWC